MMVMVALANATHYFMVLTYSHNNEWPTYNGYNMLVLLLLWLLLVVLSYCNANPKQHEQQQ